MKIVLFYHSLVSDWNHGNAHFLRGVATELIAQGHNVRIYEPADGWSRQNLLKDFGRKPIQDFYKAYPYLESIDYDLKTLELNEILQDAQLVIVHEWNHPELVQRIGEHHVQNPHYVLFFHDTHHRSVTKPDEIARYDLIHYDAVLAFGEAIRQAYLNNGWAEHVFTWHEAADTRKFRPVPGTARSGDLVWVGNWGDGERTEELMEFLIEPVRLLGISATIYGVRYSEKALAALDDAGIQYKDWLPNYDVPAVFAKHQVTVHVPRRPYTEALPGIPTIRPFEALACGIPLVSAPWDDTENLFTAGKDYLIAQDGSEMKAHLWRILSDASLAKSLSEHGRQTIVARHTCTHRVNQLMNFYDAASKQIAEALPTGTGLRL